MSKWYDIKAAAADRATVYLYDEIGGKGVKAKDFAREFNAITASHIDLHVESLGGNVLQGLAIKNTIKNHPAHVTAYIDSIAGSITSAIVLACDEIRIADDAYVMIHNPSKRSEGSADDLRKDAEILDKMAEGMAQEYATRMGITVDDAKALMNAETWYLGEEAVRAKFADSTYSGVTAVACFDLSRFTAKTPQSAIERFTKSPPRGNFEPSATLTEQEEVMPDEITATDETTTVEPSDDVVVVESAVDESATTNDGNVQARVDEAVATALANERRRASEITALGSRFGFQADAESHIADGSSVEDFRAHILGKSPDDWKASLAVRNPSEQAPEEDDDDSDGDAVVAKVKERRRARMGA